MKQFTLKSLLLVLTILMGGVNAWGEEFSATYSYGSLEGWSLTNYDDATSYYIIPSGFGNLYRENDYKQCCRYS